MSIPPGCRHSLPANRRLVNDLLHFAAKTPLVPVERHFNLGGLAALRADISPRISWPVLFIKAFGLVSHRNAQLRQAYMAWPWRHLYQHPCSVAMLAINRGEANQDHLFWGRFIAPEARSLSDLQQELDRYKHEPVAAVFRRQVRLAMFPLPLRRIAWWLTLNSGPKRAKRLGTFGLSTLAGLGAYNRHHPSCLSTSLSYGPVDASGHMLVTLLFDHRMLDGATIARELAELEMILQNDIAAELRAMLDQPGAELSTHRAA
jgi:hypothetical protein